ncbi:MAG: peptide ABC transporter ATP-binding protein [Sulfurimonas sp. RIFCSPHIGHO2_12_FULL_36_9]|uniref:ABC transporter ATP-binding protein n=1 Tax=Sulfurimonas sp. RIFCSPLOWO2_12_36_12 TaxID=1802253 RepID=UPI0008C200BC|nr:ABC transporter ATP-binding protein [Sulfurimonas sp. RIFCSPLOWO2_12_36_12]OHD96665.1 MAG: peptide ABC transporter ATP-binding protein [Sulfurimonas sp. RIFCSPHIGHO2_12_FULL_36_9]OHE00184.1 MAG: peptide ABC transporter ATP-binding protein [Sulfurimonas sp. RIFCSPLOWO2_12_36_12]OHE00797.1 MAG: peptide ABC transporter ATP-binding protein [Sulfurimonas sp. RIFCSPLOWO2_02_FULL_36_28]OHE08549.1 MAG: peptide ABC transporter ATP-binding protein [Sulfurimonas sp. RIFCSPLOWO2_12_FULL_36_74]
MIKASNISHFYGAEQVLYNLSFEIKEGGFVFLSGESGSGKSTLLSILSTLLKPSSGELLIDEVSIDKIKNIDSFRQNRIGFVFQFHYLINYLSVYENIALAALEEKKQNINKILEELGILEFSSRYPNEISGGQRQRVAVARALVNEPKIIFADEPTGSLDSKNSTIVYELLREAVKNGTTVVVASHDMQIESYATQIIRLKDGQIL